LNRVASHRVVSPPVAPRSRLRVSVLGAAAVAALFAAPGAASAQQLYSFTVSAAAGFGGSLDADPGDEITLGSYQIGGAIVTEPQTLVGVRYGRIGFDDDQPLETLFDADLTYLTLAGEYKFDETFYEGGMYVGVGGYRLEGVDAAGASQDDTSFGLAIGVTGEFPITRRFGVVVEFAGHYTDLDVAQFFATGQAGLAVHF
jgi:hypothetical protein